MNCMPFSKFVQFQLNTSYGREEVAAIRMVSESEERGYADWMNKALQCDAMCIPYLPINSVNLYDKCADGVLFCKMINYSVPDTIDVRAINTGKKLEKVFCKNENLSLAVQSASAIGCCTVNIGPIDIGNGVKHILLGLLWQIIKIGLIGKINLTAHAELIVLLHPGESLDDLKQLTPEEMLIRWVNYHLQNAKTSRRITNFNYDVMDSEVYAYLLNQIAPAQYQSHLKFPTEILRNTELITRANHVLDNAEILGARAFVNAEDIVKATEKGKNRTTLNMAFVANLFNHYPALYVSPGMAEDYDIVEETLEEKMYRNWMNSMGADPFVKDLYVDLRNGLVLLYLIDVIRPNTVNKSKVITNFNPKKKLFEMQENCVLFLKYAKELDIKIVNISAENIREGNQVLILGLCFRMLRKYTFQLLFKLQPNKSKVHIGDQDILEWANKKCNMARKNHMQIESFRDYKIKSSTPIVDLIEAIKPGSVDYSFISHDYLDNAKYVVTVARKIGANVYALPQHVVDLNPKMIMTIYACLMLVDLKSGN